MSTTRSETAPDPDPLHRAFVVIDRKASPASRYNLLLRLRPSHFVFIDQDTYFLLRTSELPASAFIGPDAAAVHLNPTPEAAVPGFDIDEPAGSRPERYVLTERGRVLGVRDPEVAIPDWGTLRGTSEARRVDRYLGASLAAEVPADQEFSLLLFLRATGAGDELHITLPAGSRIEVSVLPLCGASLVDPEQQTRTLLVDDEPESAPVLIKLRPTGIGSIRVLLVATSQGQVLGSQIVRTQAVAPGTQTEPAVRSQTRTQPLLNIEPSRWVDLSLVIEEHAHASGMPAYSFLLCSAKPGVDLNFKRFGPIPMTRKPETYFEKFYTGIDDLLAPKAYAWDHIRTELEQRGTALFRELFPEELQRLLWSLQDRIDSVLIQSMEPFIPWELCRLTGVQDGRRKSGEFFCQRFALSRWFAGERLHDTLSLRDVGLIVPGDSKLPQAQAEARFVRSLAGPERLVRPIQARLFDVLDALKQGRHTCLHFTGHGDFSLTDTQESLIVLEDEESLCPYHLSGEVENLGLAAPLVFLNACCTGRMSHSLTRLSGWAQSFVQAGAAAFLGGLYSVSDAGATSFARHLYTELLDGRTLAESARRARLQLYAAKDPTWLAYSVYGHPLARLES